MMTNGFARRSWAVLLGLLLAAPALATVVTPAAPATTQAATPVHEAAFTAQSIWPHIGPAAEAWFAVVVILVLVARFRPILQWRNLDALILAVMGLLIVARYSQQPAGDAGHSWQWWSYLGLTIGTVYFLLRGLGLLIAKGTPRYGENVSGSALLVLLVAALAIGIQHLATAPLSASAKDGLIGGLCFDETDRLPYGASDEIATRSPLLYLLDAGAAEVAEPTYVPDQHVTDQPLRWSDRSAWMGKSWAQEADLSTVDLVNTTLFILALLGLYVVGVRLGTLYHGGLLVALFVIFPGTQAVLAHPGIMLAVVLLIWTLAFALLPAVGGLLAGFTLVMAGLAWPWAWLGLPILFAYMIRRGWHALGVSVGMLAGIALAIAGLYYLVTPSLPRADRAVAIAGKTPEWQAHMAEGDTLVLARREPNAPAGNWHALTSPLWRLLLRADPITMESASAHVNVDWPNGTAGRDVPMYMVEGTPEAEARLRQVYTGRMALQPPATQIVANLRTVLESTWLAPSAHQAPQVSTWEFWSGAPVQGGMLWVRRGVKIVVGLLVILTMLILFFAQPITPRRLAAGMLLVSAGALLASGMGPVTNHVWLLPALLMVWVLPEESVGRKRAAQRLHSEAPPQPFNRGPAPRITKED